jgi:hypothetical protein
MVGMMVSDVSKSIDHGEDTEGDLQPFRNVFVQGGSPVRDIEGCTVGDSDDVGGEGWANDVSVDEWVRGVDEGRRRAPHAGTRTQVQLVPNASDVSYGTRAHEEENARQFEEDVSDSPMDGWVTWRRLGIARSSMLAGRVQRTSNVLANGLGAG